MSLNLHYILLLFIVQALSPSPLRTSEPMKLTIDVKHVFGTDPLLMDEDYLTLHNDQVTLTKFKYYLGNLQLKTRQGIVWRDADTYHLIDVNDETSPVYTIQMDNIPQGDYTTLSFSVGVDSIRNHSGEQEGVLNPDHGMFWMWETGYVFFKMEGLFKSEGKTSGALVYHIGRDECYRTVDLQLPQNLHLLPGRPAKLTIMADVRKVFGGFTHSAIDLRPSTNPGSIRVMGGAKAPKVANNFMQIFSVAR